MLEPLKQQPLSPIRRSEPRMLGPAGKGKFFYRKIRAYAGREICSL